MAWSTGGMPKAYVVCNITVTDPKQYETYKELSTAALAANGGRFLVRGGAVEVLEGSPPSGRLVVLEFDSADAARQWYESPEYRAARAARQQAATGSFVLVVGTND